MKYFLKSLPVLFATLILAIIILPLGFVYDIGKSIWENRTILSFIKRIAKLVNEVFIVLGDIIWALCIGIDQIGNVCSGELIEDCITAEENTTFRQSGITISASTGKLETEDKLNKTGKWFTKTLSKIFEKNHSILAYKHWLRSKEPLN